MPGFVAVDWGTSSLRLWSIDERGGSRASTDGPFGMARIPPETFAAVLDERIAALGVDPATPVLACGMVGAAQGWCEAPYLAAPTRLSSLGESAVRVLGTAREVHILPGVMQDRPANVMRGEETQILGLLAERPGFDGVVCLPGTHCKWVRVHDGRITTFTTCMTGELFALLAERSILKHSVGEATTSDRVAVSADFLNASIFAAAEPAAVAESLFALRAETLLHSLVPAAAGARLSGLLIGLELAATRRYWDAGFDVVLIGDAGLSERYAAALAGQSVDASVLDGESMTVRGLVAAFEQRSGG